MSRRSIAALCSVALLAACGHRGAVGTLRFKNQPPVWKVNDRTDVPKPPKRSKYYRALEIVEGSVVERITQQLAVPEPRRAMDVNSLDEVPDSTWFTNRIGARELTTEEIAAGPNGAGPDLSGPLQVTRAKTKGTLLGVIARDQTGQQFLIKFDTKTAPVVESATDPIVQRLLWACGYNVPENFVIYFEHDQLTLADDAMISDKRGKRPMTQADLDTTLARIDRRPDGRYRALASKYLPGKPIGGFAPRGVRKDDPNDVIPHEHRRSIRGLYVIYSWFQYTDVKPDNTLDVWVEDERDPSRHYVRHYLVDFGKSMGAFSLEGRPSDGHSERYDPLYDVMSLFTFGLWKRPWEGTRNPGIEGVATFDAEHFQPGRWSQGWPYQPFRERDVYDALWGARIVMRFTPELIRTAVEQGQFEDPAAVEYLTEVLIGRQQKIGKHWFSVVNPLDDFRLDGETLCFRDLLVHYGFAGGVDTSYRLAAYDFKGKSLGWTSTTDQTCVEGFPVSDTDHGYTILTVDTKRRGHDLAPVEVHLARDAAQRLRIIGIERR